MSDESGLSESLHEIHLTQPSHHDSSRGQSIPSLSQSVLQARMKFSIFSQASELTDIAARILSDMTLDCTHIKHGFPLTGIFKRPLPYDSSNHRKCSLMMEMMKSAGEEPISVEVWKKLSSVFDSNVQSTPIVLRIGVSGLGKTKAAYDIGMNHAFVVMCRIVEHDNLTAPWSKWHEFMTKVCHYLPEASAASLSECAKASMLILIKCHLQWALDVCKVAMGDVMNQQFQRCVDERIRENSNAHGLADEDDVYLRALREIVLRCQRTGLAHDQVSLMFMEEMNNYIDEGIVVNNDDLVFSEEFAMREFRLVMDEAKELWGSCSTDSNAIASGTPKIVFVYDEVQALVHISGLPSDLFKSPKLCSEASVSYGCFYGLIHTMRTIYSGHTCGHLMLSPNLDIKEYFQGEHSPAQNLCSVITAPLNLTSSEIKEWFSYYLCEDYAEHLDEKLVARLEGRALFSSKFWVSLLCAIRGAIRKGHIDPKIVVEEALNRAYLESVETVRDLLCRMFSRYNPDRQTQQIPHRVISWLYFSIIMSPNILGKPFKYRSDINDVIVRGILNGSANVGNEGYLMEPVLEDALLQVGKTEFVGKTDYMLRLLAGRMTEPARGDTADQGPSQEDCISWLLVEKCIFSGPQLLGNLLKPWFSLSSNPPLNYDDYQHLLEKLNEYEVNLEGGKGCDDCGDNGYPLSLLEKNPKILLFTPPSRMGGPDIMFVATHIVSKKSKLVCLQLKNEKTPTLPKALKSLNCSNWYNGMSERQALVKKTLERNGWGSPIRGVIHSMQFSHELILTSLWLNRFKTSESPLLFLSVNRSNIGVEIAAPGSDVKDITLTDSVQDCLTQEGGTIRSMTVMLSSKCSIDKVAKKVKECDERAQISNFGVFSKRLKVTLTKVSVFLDWLENGFFVNNNKVNVVLSHE